MPRFAWVGAGVLLLVAAQICFLYGKNGDSSYGPLSFLYGYSYSPSTEHNKSAVVRKTTNSTDNGLVRHEGMNLYNLEQEALEVFPEHREIIVRLQKTRLRFYMYMDERISLSDIWNDTTGHARVEVHVMRAFQRHALRTHDPDEAEMFIIPTPMHALRVPHINAAFEALESKPTFRKHQGRRHVLFAMESRLFDSYAKGRIMKRVNAWSERLENVTIVRNHDMFACLRMHNDKQDHGDWNWLFSSVKPTIKYTFSAGILASPDVPFIPASLGKFLRSPLLIFYRTRREGSAFGSTKFRHAPVQLNVSDLPSPVSIGFDLDYEAWIRDLTGSKFCLVIRGDTPHSHSLLGAVQVGCIPVVICDYYPDYAPTFKSFLNMTSFSIMVRERDFIANPLHELRLLQSLSRETILSKLAALRFAQQLTSVGHPKSLFVPAILNEAALANPSTAHLASEVMSRSLAKG